MTEPVRESRPRPGGQPPLPAPEQELRSRLRWLAGRQVGEVELDTLGAPCLVPAGERAAELASLTLDALDTAADEGRARIQVRAGAAQLFLDAGWPLRGSVRPSMAIGGGEPRPSEASRLARLREDRSRLDDAALRLGRAALQEIQDYPRRRRELASRRLRLEGRVVRLDDRLGRVRTTILLGGAGVATGLAGASAGVLAPSAGLLAAGAGLFFVSAGLIAARRFQRPLLVDRRRSLEQRLGRVLGLASKLDERALHIASQMNLADPWEAAAKAAEWAESRDDAPRGAGSSERAREAAAGLAERVGLDLGALAADGSPPPVSAEGWPLEVAAIGPGVDADGLRWRVLAAGRLLARIEQELPAPWPLVLCRPWPDAEPDERARLLMAVAQQAGRRPTIAFV